jgi:hypothetical protein
MGASTLGGSFDSFTNINKMFSCLALRFTAISFRFFKVECRIRYIIRRLPG